MLHLFPPYFVTSSLRPYGCASEKPRLAKKYFAYWLTLFMSHHLSGRPLPAEIVRAQNRCTISKLI